MSTYTERPRKGGGTECYILPESHQWGDGPDGMGYHCSTCGISKCEDHDGTNCAIILNEKGKLPWRKLIPIAFTAENAQKVHDGTKTQVRILLKPQPPNWVEMLDKVVGDNFHLRGNHPKGVCGHHNCACIKSVHGSGESLWTEHPRYRVGDVLFCREPWRVQSCDDHVKASELRVGTNVQFEGEPPPRIIVGKLRSATTLPLRFARLHRYEVVAVRCERVNAISEADALAEGCDGNCPVGYILAHQAGPCRYHFAQLWDSIHQKPGTRFADAPWCFVVEWRKVR